MNKTIYPLLFFCIIYIFFILFIAYSLPLKLASNYILEDTQNQYFFYVSRLLRAPFFFLGKGALPLSSSIIFLIFLKKLNILQRKIRLHYFITIFFNPLIIYWMGVNLRDFINILLLSIFLYLISNEKNFKNITLLSTILLLTIALLLNRPEQILIVFISVLVANLQRISNLFNKLFSGYKIKVKNFIFIIASLFLLIIGIYFFARYVIFIDPKDYKSDFNIFDFQEFKRLLINRSYRSIIYSPNNYGTNTTFNLPDEYLSGSMIFLILKSYCSCIFAGFCFPNLIKSFSILFATLTISINAFFSFFITIQNSFRKFLSDNIFCRYLFIFSIIYLIISGIFQFNLGNGFRNALTIFFPLSICNSLYIDQKNKLNNKINV